MDSRLRTRWVARATATTIALATLGLAPPAVAAPVFDEGNSSLGAGAGVGTGSSGGTSCENDPATPQSARADAEEIEENGPWARASAEIDGASFPPSAPDRITRVAVRHRVMARLRSAGDQPTRIDVRSTATGEISFPDQEPDPCVPVAQTSLGFSTVFVVSRPTVLELDADVEDLLGRVDLESTGGTARSVRVGLDYLASQSSTLVTLSPGTWRMAVEARQDERAVPGEIDGHVDVSAVFTDPGSQRSSTGAGRTWLTLPAVRDCSTGTVSPTVTTDRAQARAVRRISLAVDGRAAGTVRRPRPGAALTVPAARTDRPTTVRATVVLDPARPGGPVRQRTATATYQSCGG